MFVLLVYKQDFTGEDDGRVSFRPISVVPPEVVCRRVPPGGGSQHSCARAA